MDVKISDIILCTQELIGGGEVTLIMLGPLKCFMPIRMEYCGEWSNGRDIEAVNGMICAPCFILDVEMELF
jgi:hypothetical protein